jgi:hypothetical protein
MGIKIGVFHLKNSEHKMFPNVTSPLSSDLESSWTGIRGSNPAQVIDVGAC